MLIDFAITNYRSIKDRQVFSMLTAGKVKELPDNVAKIDKNINLLKSAVIYGRNASGKSNFLKGLNALNHFVSESANLKVNDKNTLYTPFIFEANSLNKPVEFEVNFIAKNNIRYNYQISFLEDKIIKESLHYFPNKVSAKLFIREDGKPIDFSDVIKGNKKEIEKSLYPNQLFLSKVGTERIEQLVIPYLFLEKGILQYGNKNDEVALDLITRKIEGSTSFKENINKLLELADTGINGITVNKWISPVTSYSFLTDGTFGTVKNEKYIITTKHDFFEKGAIVKETYLDFSEESEGTIKLLVLGGLILETIEEGTVLIIDELDKSLHPRLTRALIYIFNNPSTNPKNAQLIFATHDVSLLSNEIFRRDQIWFTQKESDGKTTLYSLSDLQHVRNTVSYEKYYMRGAFGSVPVINEYDLNFKFDDEKTK